MFAQSLIESGALDTIAAGVQQLTDVVGSWVQSFSPTAWAVAAIALLALIVWSCR
jgi:hypothetical protein